METQIKQFIQSPDALEMFESSLDQYLTRTGNLKIPLFYVDENGVPIGQLYAIACDYWSLEKKEDPFFSRVDRKFFVENLWPKWGEWCLGSSISTDKGVRVFDSFHSLPSTTPSLVRMVSPKSKNSIASLYCQVLSVYLFDHYQSSNDDLEKIPSSWTHLTDLIRLANDSYDAGSRGKLDAGDHTILEDCARRLYDLFDVATRESFRPALEESSHRVIDKFSYGDLLDDLDACVELVGAINLDDPLSINAYLDDLRWAEEIGFKYRDNLADCVSNLMWDLVEIEDNKAVAIFAAANTQLIDSYLSRAHSYEIESQESRINLNVISNNILMTHLAFVKGLFLERMNLVKDFDCKAASISLSKLDAVDFYLANIPFGARISSENGKSNKSTKSIAVEPVAIKNIANSLANDGRAIVVVSDRVLFSEAREFFELRQFLIDEYCVEDIIALRGSANKRLSEQSSIDFNLLVFSKKESSSSVRFTVLKGVDKNELSHKELPHEKFESGWLRRLIQNVDGSETDQDGRKSNNYQRESQSRLAQRLQFEDTWTETIEELREKNLNLVPRNLKSSQWMKLIEKCGKQDDISILKLGDLFDVISPASLSSRKLEETAVENGIPVLEASRIKGGSHPSKGGSHPSYDRLLPPKRKVQLPDNFPEDQRLRRGDIAISTKGTLGKFVVIAGFESRGYVGAVPGSTITILRPKKISQDHSGFHDSWMGIGSKMEGGKPNKTGKVNSRRLASITEDELPQYVAAFFQTDAFQDWLGLVSRGASIQSISAKDLCKCPIPVTLNKQRATDAQRVFSFKDNTFSENQTELENILLGRYQPFERFVESNAVKKFLEFFHQVRSSRRGPLSETLAGTFDSGSAFSVNTGMRKNSQNCDSRDLLKEFRPLVRSVFDLGSKTAREFYRAQSKSESRPEEAALMRTFDSFTFPLLYMSTCTDSGLQFGLWQQALNDIKGLENYLSSPETKKLIVAANEEKSKEWIFSDSATVLWGITSYFEAEIKRALQDLDFEVGLVSQPEISENQEELEVQVYFKNLSKLPLCRVTVKAGQDHDDQGSGVHPDFEEWGQHHSIWLYPGETHQFSVIIPNRKAQVLTLTDQEIEERKRFDEFVKGFDSKELPSLEEKLFKEGHDPKQIEATVSAIIQRKKALEEVEKLEKVIQEIDRMKKLEEVSEEASDENGTDIDDRPVVNYYEEKALEGLSQIVEIEEDDDPRKIEIIFSIEGRTLSGNFIITASESEGGMWPFLGDENSLHREDKRLRVTVTPKTEIQQTTISQESINPYIVGNPIDRKEMLFGRDQVLAEIKQQLGTSSTQANPVLIEGNRRTGKTSILHELQRVVKTDKMIPVYVSLQSGEGSKDSRPGLDTAEVFRLIARHIGFALNDFGVEVELPGEDLTNPDKNFRFQFTRKLSSAFKSSKPFETLRLYVEQALDAVAPRKILLMLDEFDHLHVGTQSGVTNPQVPDNIRSLVHEHKNLALIISGTKELKKIRDDYWSTLFGFAYTIPVSGLSEDAAGDLVKIPAQGQLIYQAGAVDEIVRLSGNQPFLIQTLCSRIFSGAVETGNPSVGKSQVANAAERMGKDNEHFRNLFSREINSDLQRIIFVMIVKNFERDGTRFNRGGIEQELYNQNVPYLEEEIDDEIDHLISLELVKNNDTDGSDSSGFEPLVPFFGIWINQNVDYEQLIQTIRDQVI